VPGQRYTVDEYHRLIQSGALTEESNVELLEGWITPKMSRDPDHDLAIELVNEVMPTVLPPGWTHRIQSAITTPDSEPEPDCAAVRGPARARRGRHPLPTDIGLIAEIANTTLAQDRGPKLRVYALAGIVCYWIINLVDRQIEVYTDPTGPDANPTYRQRRDYRPGDEVPLVLDGAEVARIAVAELLP
jgi:hypothetical protein